ncbi:hypothetical protein CEUSTIGMA_g8692.t1 [Chlamydomonas eustigma]|uniref:Uncharacterized protein n=1 Tax=Chlamydomonas eustigma TaxID=1157962 RepID=A0A250XEP5_9CHLO|nr:hypothetical protein CEUSTIGMA_g8692.t1 [Chlamydomonas eustigma]|eukprot:GAX81260.1 hypothetical protein CEUSTIGMA_g8692.t1 [Chlamydomonas eustigma]
MSSVMMRFALAISALCAVAALPTRPSGDCVSPSSLTPSTNIFPSQFQISGTQSSLNKAQVTIAENFDVTYFDTYKVVTNTQVNETYVLYQCGTQPPSSSSFSTPVKFFSIPLTSSYIPDTTSAAFYNALLVSDRIGFVTEDVDEPCLQMLASSTCNLETDYSTKTSVLGTTEVDSEMTYGASPTQPKAIAFTASGDPGVLNRVEWLKFLATFFNKEVLANSLFNAISSNYQTIATTATSLANQINAQPKLMAWITWWPQSYAFADTDGISFDFPAYKQEFTNDAGAAILNMTYLQPFMNLTAVPEYPSSTSVYIYANQTSALRQILANVDFVVDSARYYDASGVGIPDTSINLAAFLTRYGLSTSDVSTMKFLKNGGLIRLDAQTNPLSYNQWFGSAVVRPDQVLADFVQLLYPAQQPLLTTPLSKMPGATVQVNAPFFLRNVISGPAPTLLTSTTCPYQNCALPVSAICPTVYLACNGSLVYATSTQPCAPACPNPSVSGTYPPTLPSPPQPPPPPLPPSPGRSQAVRPAMGTLVFTLLTGFITSRFYSY